MPATDVVTPRFGRAFYAFNALLALSAVTISFTLNATGYYVDKGNPDKPYLLGNIPGGVDTFGERFFDWITYFTIWSNITVAVVMTVLAFRPAILARQDGVGLLWRVLRLDSLLMIIVTGAVYNLLLTEPGKTGWDAVSNALLHMWVPLLTPIIWVLAGPRGAINPKTIGLALILPIIWAAFALTRSQIIHAYPYPFLNVDRNGWASVLTFIVVIVVITVILAFIMWGIDRALMRMSRRAD
jgi:hypothetical protein